MNETPTERWRKRMAAEAHQAANAFPPPCPECGATFGCGRADPDCHHAIAPPEPE